MELQVGDVVELNPISRLYSPSQNEEVTRRLGPGPWEVIRKSGAGRLVLLGFYKVGSSVLANFYAERFRLVSSQMDLF